MANRRQCLENAGVDVSVVKFVDAIELQEKRKGVLNALLLRLES